MGHHTQQRNPQLYRNRSRGWSRFLDLNYSAISELCAQSSMGDKGYVFILDQNGNIVYHPQQQQLYNELQTENISLVMNAKSDIVTVGKEMTRKFMHCPILISQDGLLWDA